MKRGILLLPAVLALTGCGGAAKNEAAAAQTTAPDAVTAEAIADTNAAVNAQAEAMAAADAELDNLDDSIDDRRGGKAGNGEARDDKAGANKAGVRDTTAVVTY